MSEDSKHKSLCIYLDCWSKRYKKLVYCEWHIEMKKEEFKLLRGVLI